MVGDLGCVCVMEFVQKHMARDASMVPRGASGLRAMDSVDTEEITFVMTQVVVTVVVAAAVVEVVLLLLLVLLLVVIALIVEIVIVIVRTSTLSKSNTSSDSSVSAKAQVK